MDNRFFKVPFASNGDTQTIQDETDNEGFVSFNEGWGGDYERDLRTDTRAKPVGRKEMNYVLNAITRNIRQYQTTGFPEFITAADNNGAAFAYDTGVVVMHNNALYLSLVSNNTSVPGTDESTWQVYIQRESTEGETLAGVSAISAITPRRLKLKTDIIENSITDISSSLSRVGNLQVAQVYLESSGVVTLTVPTDCVQILLIGRYVTDGVESRDRWDSTIYANGELVDTTSFYGFVTGGSGHGHHRREFLPFSKLIDMQVLAGDPINFQYTSNRNSNTTFTVFYIQGVSTEEPDQPSTIIISPLNSVINAGTSQQLIAMVLPSSAAAEYPVTWQVSDPALGTIDSNGRYSANVGASGTQSVIASVSTGLASTAIITQHIFLAGIEIGDAPADLVAGNTYTVPVTYTPSNYTEAILTSSSDSTSATLSALGTLSISNAGSTTLSLAGANSGITKSITIVAVDKETPDVFLKIENNLSDVSSISEARENLELGELATKDSLTAGDVGAVHIADVAIVAELDLNSMTGPGEYFQNISSNALLSLNYPINVAGALKVYRTGVDEVGCRQVYMPYNSTSEYRRYAYGDPLVFSAWIEK
ncbi:MULTISPECIES: Ig-like domain-containing protein [Yersinia pseudotuberculosis complex]|uniref:Bacterial Ig-like domain (Group 2) protein n=1 Tax=Yersinia pseudotuberculosis serotype O:1b (strain IP 31758) TaxID=349747 RepID=A0A0U1QU55_YERP3|nr:MULTISPECIES: Ig-like domain-containing protein [Yersinia pseudotuberculosis complex]ABS45939.1 bacterial Ig-like domain (group 2) protein [Yersinia pseudotuberculosis IP 31758]MCE4111712.1 Ig-like domain-containing protein [Yersinia pseudotuberculosis]MCF1163868.1 Ig-like domain-containing protein [Yersinia pseudotuberculosis]RYC26437.1 phage tail protein [Yersinia pseudotuberculosis]UFA62606.1 Ig-like domain-containing protein [Yersinia pseudotuberculosis]